MIYFYLHRIAIVIPGGEKKDTLLKISRNRTSKYKQEKVSQKNITNNLIFIIFQALITSRPYCHDKTL